MTLSLLTGLVALLGVAYADFPDCINGPVSHILHDWTVS
jgi:hypothetical protein